MTNKDSALEKAKRKIRNMGDSMGMDSINFADADF